MRKHAKHSHAHVNSFSMAQKVSCVHIKVGIFYLFIIFYFRDSVCCHFEKINEKNPWENKKVTLYFDSRFRHSTNYK